MGKWTGSWVAAETAASVFGVLGSPDAFVGVALADDVGNLRVVASHGRRTPLGRRRSSGRRQALATRREVSVELPGASGQRLTVLPMLVENEALGVVEVIASSTRVAERRDAILALVRQSALLVTLTRERAESERTLRENKHLSNLMADLMAATDPFQAMAAAAMALSCNAWNPVVIIDLSTGRALRLGATCGVSPSEQADLRRTLGTISARIDDETIASLTQHVETILRRTVDAVVAHPVVLLASRSKETNPGSLQAVATLLGQGLIRDGGETRRHRDEIGLALAAHELKGPLVGARAALDHVLANGSGADKEALLRRTRIELENLTQLVGPLLEWGAGRGELRKRDGDLVEIVKDAMASCLFVTSEARLRLDAPEGMLVRADAPQLRTAIANLIRNALSYSPPHDVVTVSVRADGNTATVTVHDRGPGVLLEELDAIFQPFARGRVGRSSRSGNGLGLFIARRVIEAHGGAIEIEPGERGATFAIRLPVGAIPGSDLTRDGPSPSLLSA